MSYTSWSVVFGEQPSASKWNILGTNDASFNDGTGIADNAILNRHLSSGIVTPNELDLDPADSFVFTDQTTTSTTYADLATAQSVTVNIGANGLALVLWSGGIYNVAAQKYIGVAVSGANTVAASDNEAIRQDAAAFGGTQGRAKLFTGLNAGSTTFALKFRTASGTANFFSRRITVIPL